MSQLQLQRYEPQNQTTSVPPSALLEETIGYDWGLPPITIEVFEAPANQLLIEVANQLELSVVVPDSATTTLMTVRYIDTPAQQIFEDIADQLGLVPDFDGSAIRFLESDEAIRDFLVLRSGYKPSSELVDDLTAILNNTVRVRAVDDRVVVSGKRRDLEQVKKLERHFQTGPDGWTLNIRIVAVTESFRRDLGLDWDFSANLGFTADDLSSIIDSTIAVRVIAEATQSQTDAVLAYQATIHVLEGSSSNLTQGRRVPVPRFQTSPEGTTTTVGYDYIDAGFNLDVSAQRVPVGVRLQITPSISSVAGFVQDAPITEESTVTSDVVVHDGQWVIITGLSTDQYSNSLNNIPGLPKSLGADSKLADKSSLLILVQARRTFQTGQSSQLEQPTHATP